MKPVCVHWQQPIFLADAVPGRAAKGPHRQLACFGENTRLCVFSGVGAMSRSGAGWFALGCTARLGGSAVVNAAPPVSAISAQGVVVLSHAVQAH